MADHRPFILTVNLAAGFVVISPNFGFIARANSFSLPNPLSQALGPAEEPFGLHCESKLQFHELGIWGIDCLHPCPKFVGS
jgi:hypothetical protein